MHLLLPRPAQGPQAAALRRTCPFWKWRLSELFAPPEWRLQSPAGWLHFSEPSRRSTASRSGSLQQPKRPLRSRLGFNGQAPWNVFSFPPLLTRSSKKRYTPKVENAPQVSVGRLDFGVKPAGR
jgi:hypothetical protein